jgi:cobalt-zinc-cadmium efflux system membrane fusion protein
MTGWLSHFGVCTLLVVVAAGSACRKREAAPSHAAAKADAPAVVELTAEGMSNAGIEVVRLGTTTFAPHLKVAASIVADPRKIAEIGARLPGRVAAVRVQLGDHVERGQALVEVDGVEVHQVSLDYLSAVARLRAADDALARQEQLVGERVGAVADLRRAESDRAAAKATLDEATEHLQFLGLSKQDVASLGRSTAGAGHKSVVRAPIPGRIAGLNVTLGQVLTGDEPIVTVADLDQVAVNLRVYERDVAQIRRGATVDVEVPAYPGQTFRGNIGFIGDLIDPITRTLQARVDLPNPNGALKPGMTAVASLAIAGEKGLWIPADAVQPHEGGRAVFIAIGPRRFRPLAVSVGAEQGGYVPVLGGIAAGVDVVVRGAFTLRAELERAALEED